MTVDDLIRDSLAAMETGGAGATALLPRTERRDVVTAVSRWDQTRAHGRCVRTEFRLNGDRISQRAAELLLAAYG